MTLQRIDVQKGAALIARAMLEASRDHLTRIANGTEPGFNEPQRARVSETLASMDHPTESLTDLWRAVRQEGSE